MGAAQFIAYFIIKCLLANDLVYMFRNYVLVSTAHFLLRVLMHANIGQKIELIRQKDHSILQNILLN